MSGKSLLERAIFLSSQQDELGEYLEANGIEVSFQDKKSIESKLHEKIDGEKGQGTTMVFVGDDYFGENSEEEFVFKHLVQKAGFFYYTPKGEYGPETVKRKLALYYDNLPKNF